MEGCLLSRSRPQIVRWAMVSIETAAAVYVGRMYVPEDCSQATDVLGDGRTFVSLTQVIINDSSLREPFVAVNKQYIREFRVTGQIEVHQVVPLSPRDSQTAFRPR